jgi:hypothetical protein
VYAAGDYKNSLSWNATALGEFLYIDREDPGISLFYPYTGSKTWDGGVLSLRDAGVYSAWPVDPSFAGGLLGEVNGVFFNESVHLRLGRIRRDWGPESAGTSLVLNAQARPFTAIEGTVSPHPWLGFSFLGGALEQYRTDNLQPRGPFTNLITLAQVEFNPFKYIHLSFGGSAVLLHSFNGAFFSNLELTLPGIFKLWGSLYIDRLDSPLENLFISNSNNFAYQAGIKAPVRRLPFASFTLQYTKVEPYCYSNFFEADGWENLPSASAFVSGGESLGYYLPPNSDELLLRFESRLFPDIKAHVQFQMARRGADYGYGAVGGSSLRDKNNGSIPYTYFLKDGVYRWDNVIKLGGSGNVNAGTVPLAVYAETGFVITRYTINGSAGSGNEAEYESLNDSVYRAGNGFIFSVGFRMFR